MILCGDGWRLNPFRGAEPARQRQCLYEVDSKPGPSQAKGSGRPSCARLRHPPEREWGYEISFLPLIDSHLQDSAFQPWSVELGICRPLKLVYS